MILRARSPAAMGALLLAFACAHPADAETIPPRGATDPRVRTVAYDPDDVVKLHGYVGYQIHIEWAPGEEFVNLGAGDVGGFDVGVEKNHFFIKPKQEQVNTNITVLTTARAYHFDYRASKPPLQHRAPADLVYSLRFVYPADQRKAAAAAAVQAQTEALLQRPTAEATNTDYWYCGDPSLKPLAASDNGLHTRLRFAPQGDLPALFVENDDHTESLLNFHVEGSEIVVHRLARRLILRRGALVGCVVNAAFDRSAPREASNTLSPAVYRDTPGVNP